ncbi:holo-ACP synthase [Helicobacter suis]|uniref:holo-ACP synthase n=1 Tax=Helicobacter suis TaxID=104628 RepID=UPI0013D52C70|nr:holo-ACP synthase [Helicobacter suis]
MIGVDIVCIARITDNISRHKHRFLNKFLSTYEQTLFIKPHSIAGAWAAKEACSKALGVGICAQLRFLDMCLSKNTLGAPILQLTPEKQILFKIQNLHVSISHDRGFAVAVVLAQFLS